MQELAKGRGGALLVGVSLERGQQVLRLECVLDVVRKDYALLQPCAHECMRDALRCDDPDDDALGEVFEGGVTVHEKAM